MTVRVLFVCLGNICRSPMAEAVFQQLVNEAGLDQVVEVDSAGTGAWHVGERAHPGTRQVLAQHSISYDGRARQVREIDFAAETYVVAMDASNIRDLRRRFGDYRRLYRLLDFADQQEVQDVPDPYYSDNFDFVFELVKDGCRGLLSFIRQEEKL